MSYVPEYRTQSPIRDANAELFLSQTVSNPFVGLTLDAPGSNGATIVRRRLLCQNPQFEASGICTGNGTFCTETDNGSNYYHGMILRADKRFTHRFMLMSLYTWSKMREKVTP